MAINATGIAEKGPIPHWDATVAMKQCVEPEIHRGDVKSSRLSF